MTRYSVREKFIPDTTFNDWSGLLDFREKHINCFASDYSIKGALAEFPYVELIEYRPTANAFATQVNRIISLGAAVAIKLININGKTQSFPIFEDLYKAEPTNNVYILPYLNEYHHETNQNWQDINGTGSPLDPVIDTIVKIKKITEVAAGYIQPKAYAGANENFVDIKFYLVNTAPVGSSADEGARVIHRNKSFLEKIIRQNLHGQNGPMVIAPPMLYSMYIPGVRYSPVSCINNILVTNLGAINNWNNYLVPDAWEVTLQMRELVSEYRVMYQDAIQGRKSADETTVRILGSKDMVEGAITMPPGGIGAGVNGSRGIVVGAGVDGSKAIPTSYTGHGAAYPLEIPK